MDMFSGWPFYEPRRCWGEPTYGGFHGATRRPGYYDHPWYPETSCSPFHRSNDFSSPFYRKNPSPFEDVFDARHPQRARTHMMPKSPTERPNGRQVDGGKCADKSKNPIDTTEATKTSSTASGDKTTNLTHTQSTSATEEVPEQHTPDAMDSQSQQPVDHEGATTDCLPPEINKIAEIMKKTLELQEKISAYDGVSGSKDYVYIEESLVAVLLQLDKIETNGNVDIRKARKSAVCQVQQMLTDLENKAESSSINNVGPSLTEVTSSTEESTVVGDEHGDAVETVMDCTSDTFHEDSIVNTAL